MKSAYGGQYHRMSIESPEGTVNSKSMLPVPNTWYATRSAPAHAYCVSGTSSTHAPPMKVGPPRVSV
jgi:hypothetical protein